MLEKEEAQEEQTEAQEELEEQADAQEELEAEEEQAAIARLDEEVNLTERERFLLNRKREADKEAKRVRLEKEKVRKELELLKKKYAEEKRARDLEDMSEKERLLAEKADAEERLRALERENLNLSVEREAVRIANDMDFIRPDDAARMIDREAVISDGVVDTASLMTQLQELAKSRDYMIKKKEEKPPAGRFPASNPAGRPRSQRINHASGQHSAIERTREAQKLMFNGNVRDGVAAFLDTMARFPEIRSGLPGRKLKE